MLSLLYLYAKIYILCFHKNSRILICNIAFCIFTILNEANYIQEIFEYLPNLNNTPAGYDITLLIKIFVLSYKISESIIWRKFNYYLIIHKLNVIFQNYQQNWKLYLWNWKVLRKLVILNILRCTRFSTRINIKYK